MPKIEGIWINDKNLRIDSFGDSVKSGDYSLMLPMINAIYDGVHEYPNNTSLYSAFLSSIFSSPYILLYKKDPAEKLQGLTGRSDGT